MKIKQHWALASILIAHITLSLVYATSVPLWDSYDGPYHYSTARYISLTGTYPNSSQTKHVDYIPQFSLYYVLAGIAMSPIRSTDKVEPELNPGGAWRRLYIYDPRAHEFPYQGTAAAVFLGRLLSIVLGTLAVACTWFIAKNLFPQRPAIGLTATLLHAFWPLSTFIGSVITNDIAVGLAGSVVLWLVSRLVASYRVIPLQMSKQVAYMPQAYNLATQKQRATIWFAILIAILAGVLSKSNGVALVGFGLPIAIWAFIRTCRQRPSIASIILLILSFLALLIYFFPYGDYLPLLYLKVRAVRYSLYDSIFNPTESLFMTLPTLIRTKLIHPNLIRYIPDYIFGIFGSVSLFMPTSWYQIARVSSLIPVFGLLLAKRRGYQARHIWLLGNAFFWMCFIAFVPSLLYNDFWQSFQARYFLPAWSALMLLIVIGLDSLPRFMRRSAMLSVVGAVCLVGLMTPIVVMRAAYNKPTFVSDRLTYSYPTQMATSLRFAESGLFGPSDMIELFGVSIARDRLVIDPARIVYADDAESWQARMRGEPMIELDWRVIKKPSANYTVQIEGVTTNGEAVPLLRAIPGYGKFPTVLWTSGDQFRERIRLPEQNLTAIRLQWMNGSTGQALESNCPQKNYCEFALPVAK
ncbi:MAG: hypothetical protein WCL57_15725 [Chloroflexota bacterium]|nr:hypothetical protein [Chloroflexota bacterium]